MATPQQNDSSAPYSDMSQPKQMQNTTFIAVDPQYPNLTQQQQQQPTYIMTTQQQVTQVVTQAPADRHSVIMHKLEKRKCCGYFSYPTGVKIVAGLQILSWFIWSVAYVAAKVWWLWLFTIVALIMCYYGFTGADRLDERRLRMYYYYTICMAVIYVLMIIVFASIGYAESIIGWFLVLVITVYWCHVLRDFVRVIHEVDFGSGSLFDQYRQSQDRTYQQVGHHDDHHDDH